MARYQEHSKLAQGILYNPNAMVFTSYNEKGIHVWHPRAMSSGSNAYDGSETAEKLFQVNFDIANAAQA